MVSKVHLHRVFRALRHPLDVLEAKYDGPNVDYAFMTNRAAMKVDLGKAPPLAEFERAIKASNKDSKGGPLACPTAFFSRCLQR